MMKALVWVIWGECLASFGAAAVMVLNEAVHPLAEPARRNLLVIYAIPYLVLAGVAWVLRRRPWSLTLLLAGTSVAVLYGTWARYAEWQLALAFLEAQAAGRHMMSCGPPPMMFAITLEYSLALITGAVASMRLFPYRPS